MPIIGVLARVEVERRDEIWERIQDDPALTPFPIEDEEERVGILIEARDLEDADRLLRERVQTIPGILGTWPVYTDVSDLASGESCEES